MSEPEVDYIKVWEDKVKTRDRNDLLIKCVVWGVLIYLATHGPGHLLIWMLTFQWI